MDEKERSGFDHGFFKDYITRERVIYAFSSLRKIHVGKVTEIYQLLLGLVSVVNRACGASTIRTLHRNYALLHEILAEFFGVSKITVCAHVLILILIIRLWIQILGYPQFDDLASFVSRLTTPQAADADSDSLAAYQNLLHRASVVSEHFVVNDSINVSHQQTACYNNALSEESFKELIAKSNLSSQKTAALAENEQVFIELVEYCSITSGKVECRSLQICYEIQLLILSV